MSSPLEMADEYQESARRQSTNHQKWSLHGHRRLAAEKTNHRHEFRGRISQMDRGAANCRTSFVCTVPLRAERDEAILRWLAYKSGVRRHRNSQPQTLSRAGQAHARPHHVADGRGAVVRLRALLRPERTGVESGE